MFAARGQIITDAAEGFGALHKTESTGDLLLKLGHPDVVLAEIVGERHRPHECAMCAQPIPPDAPQRGHNGRYIELNPLLKDRRHYHFFWIEAVMLDAEKGSVPFSVFHRTETRPTPKPPFTREPNATVGM